MARAGQASYRTVDNDVGTRSVKGVLDSMDALQVLILEDSPDDAEQMALELRHGGLEIGYERVDSRETLDAALARGGWDVIIADYVLPGFDALAALQMVKDLQLDIPFIVVSGVVGEETAVQAVKAGAHDYVLKQSLTRLGVAVSREVLEAQVRRERTQAVTASRILARRT